MEGHVYMAKLTFLIPNLSPAQMVATHSLGFSSLTSHLITEIPLAMHAMKSNASWEICSKLLNHSSAILISNLHFCNWANSFQWSVFIAYEVMIFYSNNLSMY